MHSLLKAFITLSPFLGVGLRLGYSTFPEGKGNSHSPIQKGQGKHFQSYRSAVNNPHRYEGEKRWEILTQAFYQPASCSKSRFSKPAAKGPLLSALPLFIQFHTAPLPLKGRREKGRQREQILKRNIIKISLYFIKYYEDLSILHNYSLFFLPYQLPPLPWYLPDQTSFYFTFCVLWIFFFMREDNCLGKIWDWFSLLARVRLIDLSHRDG